MSNSHKLTSTANKKDPTWMTAMRKHISTLLGAFTLGAFSIVAHAVPIQVYEWDDNLQTCAVSCSIGTTGNLA